MIEVLSGCTVMMGVPTYYSRLLAHAGLDSDTCGNLRLFVSGSAPLSSETFAEFEVRTGHRILERYGMSETNVITSNTLAAERVPGTVGFALENTSVRVADERDQSYQILEVTPARSWYPHYLGKSVGVNLPFYWYHDLLGNRLPPHTAAAPRDRIAWVDEYRDLVNAFGSWRRGELTLRNWVGSYSGVRSFALTSIRDPLPGFLIGVRLMVSVLNLFRRRPKAGK